MHWVAPFITTRTQTRESVVSLRLAKMQEEVLRLILQDRNVMLSVLRGERSIGIILVFPYELLVSKGKGKMR